MKLIPYITITTMSYIPYVYLMHLDNVIIVLDNINKDKFEPTSDGLGYKEIGDAVLERPYWAKYVMGISLTLLILMYWSFFTAMFSDPGFVTKEMMDKVCKDYNVKIDIKDNDVNFESFHEAAIKLSEKYL